MRSLRPLFGALSDGPTDPPVRSTISLCVESALLSFARVQSDAKRRRRSPSSCASGGFFSQSEHGTFPQTGPKGRRLPRVSGLQSRLRSAEALRPTCAKQTLGRFQSFVLCSAFRSFFPLSQKRATEKVMYKAERRTRKGTPLPRIPLFFRNLRAQSSIGLFRASLPLQAVSRQKRETASVKSRWGKKKRRSVHTRFPLIDGTGAQRLVTVFYAFCFSPTFFFFPFFSFRTVAMAQSTRNLCTFARALWWRALTPPPVALLAGRLSSYSLLSFFFLHFGFPRRDK